MKQLPSKLAKRLGKRKDEDSFRSLTSFSAGIDFFSNDYLGFSGSALITEKAANILKNYPVSNGATGSRLLSGNYPLYDLVESELASFHNAQSALIFNSGYDANIGFFSAVPQKSDIILYDELAHASIRDGIKMSLAKSYKFRHNDLADLREKLERFKEKSEDHEIYVVTESVFSMDGDSPELVAMTNLAEDFDALMIVDEAHATGVVGEKGEGLVQQLKIEDKVFARIHTFGKAIGSHGAAILGSEQLKNYLINYSRSFIYTTALPPHTIATISAAYQNLENKPDSLKRLQENIKHFQDEIITNKVQEHFMVSDSAIQACLLPGNSRVKAASSAIQNKGFIVKAILSPTVPNGEERLRFCIHSYNSMAEISQVLKDLGNFVANN